MTQKEDLRDYRIMGVPVLAFMGGVAVLGVVLTLTLRYFGG